MSINTESNKKNIAAFIIHEKLTCSKHFHLHNQLCAFFIVKFGIICPICLMWTDTRWWIKPLPWTRHWYIVIMVFAVVLPLHVVSYSGLANTLTLFSWWLHQMDTGYALLALCAGHSPVTGEFPAERPLTRSFDVFFDLRLNTWLSKQSWGWWFETQSHSFWRDCNV